MLNINPLAAMVTPLGDDQPLMLRRWMLVIAAPLIVGITLFGVNVDKRVSRLEASPVSEAQYEVLDHRVQQIEKMMLLYEDLRMQRERQIAELQTELRNMQKSFDQMRAEMNANFQRVFYRGR